MVCLYLRFLFFGDCLVTLQFFHIAFSDFHQLHLQSPELLQPLMAWWINFIPDNVGEIFERVDFAHRVRLT